MSDAVVQSEEAEFKRLFPYNHRVVGFTAKEQSRLLIRAQNLCLKSNRNEGVYLTRNSSQNCVHPIFIDHELFKAKRHLLVKPLFIYKLLISNSMLKLTNDVNKHRRHPSYPEEFKHGDLLKVVVPHEYCSDLQRYRVAPNFEEDEGCFRWLITDKHPHGHPYKLSEGLDENLSVFEFEI